MKKYLTFFIAFLATLASFAQGKTSEESSKKYNDSLQHKHRIDSIIRKREIQFKKSLQEDSLKMTFSIQFKEDPLMLSSTSLPINLEFKNNSDKIIRMVDLFDDLSRNFFVWVKYPDGTVVKLLKKPLTTPAAKASLNYIEIAPSQTLEKTIDLTTILDQTGNKALNRGSYRVFIAYHNTFGKDCIRGLFKAGWKKFRVLE